MPPKNADQTDRVLRRARFTARGQVQGVGFRPFVYRLAAELGLTGLVGNTSEGVAIEVQGAPAAVARFPELLRRRLPPLARLTDLTAEDLPADASEEAFRIVLSHGRHGHHVLISPDVGICGDCLADMRDPANRRYRYPFTNCTNCGPRYTITRSIPYDRAVTSMACFPLCPACAAEYGNPLDRRFHAQPVACPVCGPRLWFAERGPDGRLPEETGCTEENARNALDRCVASLLAGRLVALRGLGGFQLACDARRAASVARLRERKARPHKAFALMARDPAAVRSFCRLGQDEADLLSSPARPAVVLAPKDPGAWPGIAPDTGTLAVMLPTTPLHVELFERLDARAKAAGAPEPVLVMTSGNVSGDPICLGNREALRRLESIADDFLLHDRDILCRVDDSVCALDAGGEDGRPKTVFFRRARGYVPSPVPLDLPASGTAFGAGADLKATCCVTRGQDAFTGQHTGDLEHPAAAAFYDEVTEHLVTLLEVRPDIVVADLHPDFYTSRAAESLAARWDAPLVRLQHHAAHAAAVLAEHRVRGEALALVLDGFGLGSDGRLWGGELLRVDLSKPSWSRPGHLAEFPLPGGDAAARAPWRTALGLALTLEQGDPGERLLRRWTDLRGPEAAFVAEMVRRGINAPLSSSCGRLFDAVSAELGLCLETSYEGQAAIRLEKTAADLLDPARAGSARLDEAEGKVADVPGPGPLVRGTDEGLLLESGKLFAWVCGLRAEGYEAGRIALAFHRELALGLAELAVRARRGEEEIGLAGGVLNNALLRGFLTRNLSAAGFRVLVPAVMPPGDGGLSLGQAAWGLALLAGRKTD